MHLTSEIFESFSPELMPSLPKSMGKFCGTSVCLTVVDKKVSFSREVALYREVSSLPNTLVVI